MVWDAFVSYSHAADGALAPAVQSGLQRFMRPWYGRRALRVFRDETGLAVDPALWESIVNALDQSRFFILFASPDSVQSPWVNREIEHWCATNKGERILPVVTDGEWIWDEAKGDFDWDRSTAVPPALKGAFDQEPRHLDLRWAREADQVDTRNPKFSDAIVELAAPMHGKSKDELVGEDIRLRRRARRLAWGAVSGLALLTVASVIAAGVAVIFFQKAEARLKQAVAQRLAVQSAQFNDQPVLGFMLAAEAYRMVPSEESAGAVYKAVQGVPELSRIIRHHQSPVWSVAIIPDRDLIVSGDTDGHIIATSRKTGAIVSRFDHPTKSAITCLLPDVKGDTIAVATTGGLLNIHLEGLPASQSVSEIDESVLFCSRDRTSPRAVLVGMDGSVKLWDLQTNQLATLPFASAVKARTAAFGPEGRRLIIGDAQGGIGLWLLESAKRVWFKARAHPGEVLSAGFSPDGTRVVTGGDDGWVRTWMAVNGEPGLNHLAHTGPVRAVGYTRLHPFGEYIGSVGTDGDIQWFEAESHRPVAPTRAHTGRIDALYFADDGTYATGGDDGAVAYFDARLPRVVGGKFVTFTEVPWVIALDPAGARVAVAHGRHGKFDIFDLETLEPLGESLEVGSIVSVAAAHPRGGPIALGTADGDILLWTFGGKAIRMRNAHQGAVIDLAYAPDGRSLVSVDDQSQLKHWRVDRGMLLDPRVLSETANRTVAVDPTGRLVAFGFPGGGVDVLSLSDGKTVAQLRTNQGLGPAATAISFRSGSTFLLVGDAYGNLSLWDTRTWQVIASPEQGHRGEIAAIEFITGKDERILTAGRDGNIRVWNADTGEPLGLSLTGHSAQIQALAYDPPTRLILSAGYDGRLIARRLEPKLWVTEGCRLFNLFGRSFTKVEMQRFQLEKDSPGPCPSQDIASDPGI